MKVGGESRQDLSSSMQVQSLRGDMSTSSVLLSERHNPSITLNRQEISRLVGSRPKLGDSRSTGKLTTAHVNRSMTRLNAGLKYSLFIWSSYMYYVLLCGNLVRCICMFELSLYCKHIFAIRRRIFHTIIRGG